MLSSKRHKSISQLIADFEKGLKDHGYKVDTEMRCRDFFNPELRTLRVFAVSKVEE